MNQADPHSLEVQPPSADAEDEPLAIVDLPRIQFPPRAIDILATAVLRWAIELRERKADPSTDFLGGETPTDPDRGQKT